MKRKSDEQIAAEVEARIPDGLRLVEVLKLLGLSPAFETFRPLEVDRYGFTGKYWREMPLNDAEGRWWGVLDITSRGWRLGWENTEALTGRWEEMGERGQWLCEAWDELRPRAHVHTPETEGREVQE